MPGIIKLTKDAAIYELRGFSTGPSSIQSEVPKVSYNFDMGEGLVYPNEFASILGGIKQDIFLDEKGSAQVVSLNLRISGFFNATKDLLTEEQVFQQISNDMNKWDVEGVVVTLVKETAPQKGKELPKTLLDALNDMKSKATGVLKREAPEHKGDPAEKSFLQKGIAQITETATVFGETAREHLIRSMLGIAVSVTASLGALFYYANLQAALSAAVVSSFAWPLIGIVLVGSIVALGLGWGLSKLVSPKADPLSELKLERDSLKTHAAYFFRYLGNVARVALMNAGAVAATIALLTALSMLLVTFLAAPPLVAFVPALLVLGAIAPKLIGETLQLVGGVIRFVAALLGTPLVNLQQWVIEKANVVNLKKTNNHNKVYEASIGQKVIVGVSAFFYAIGSIIPGILWAISTLIDKVGELLTNSGDLRGDLPVFAKDSRSFTHEAMNQYRALSIYDSVPVVDSMASLKNSTLLSTLGDVKDVLSSESPAPSSAI